MLTLAIFCYLTGNPIRLTRVVAMLLVAGQLVAAGDALAQRSDQQSAAPIQLRSTSTQPEDPSRTDAMPIPAVDEATLPARATSLNQDIDCVLLGQPSGFDRRPDARRLLDRELPCPAVEAYGQTAYQQPAAEHARPYRDEYVYDGNDRGKKVTVDRDWKVDGLDAEDTVGHFDTLDGRRLVTSSNRVAIYAPRFGSVRRVDGVYKARLNQTVNAFKEKTPLITAEGSDTSESTKQHVAVGRFKGSRRASAFRDQTRGVTADNVTELFGFNDSYSPFESLQFIRYGQYDASESARLGLGLQSANVWQDNLELQVLAEKAQPVVVNDIARVQELTLIESDDEHAILRVAKIASKIAARAGETVEFTIRFDNLSGKKVGNVTIIDNLTTRLEYIVNTAECSLPAKLITRKNDAGSMMLRWEITDPLPGGQGGVIRFQCRVR